MGFPLFISCFTAVTFSEGMGIAVVGTVEQFMGHSESWSSVVTNLSVFS